VPQVKEKVFPAAGRRQTAVGPSVGAHLLRLLQQRRSLTGLGVGGILGLALGTFLLVFLGGPQQKRGVRELQTGIHALKTGDAAFALSQLELAERHLTENRETHLAQLARIGLGQLAEQKGDLAAARQQYESSAELEGPATIEALLAAARVAALMGEEDISSSYYQRLLEQYPDSPLGEIIRQKLEER